MTTQFSHKDQQPRLRISHVVVQPVLVWDDGTELSPGPQTAPKSVALTELASLADSLRKEVAQLKLPPADTPKES